MATQGKNRVVINIALFLAILAILGGSGAKGETTFTLCRMTKDGLKSCQASVDKWKPLPPSEACCAAISSADFKCLCYLKDSSLLKIYNVDPALAFDLPRKCNLDGPSFRCQ